MSAITRERKKPKWQFPALDKWIYKHRAMILQNLIPFLSIMYGLGLLVSSGPSLSSILEDRGGMSLELSAAIFVLAGAVRFGRAPGTVPPALHTMSFFPWLVYTFMAIWSASVNGSAWSIIFMYGGILALDVVLFIVEFYGGEG
ncbi:MAG: hypothetical protein ACPG7F_00510 [Aggregatilineales bacterium]